MIENFNYSVENWNISTKDEFLTKTRNHNACCPGSSSIIVIKIKSLDW